MKRFFGILLFTTLWHTSPAQTFTLDHYLEVAQTNSPLLKDLKNQASSALLDSLRLKAGYKFLVNGNGGGLFAPVIHGYGYAGSVTNYQTLDALVSVSRQLIGKSYLNAQLYAISIQRDSLINAAQVSVQDLKKTITGQYITAYGSLQQVNFSQEVVDLLSKEENLLLKLTRANVYKQSDYLAFLVTLKQQQLQLLQARLQYKNDYTTLNYLAGIADTAMITLAEPGVQRAIAPDVAASIFFKKFKLDSIRLINSRSILDYSYRPKANIFADAGYNTDLSNQLYKNFGTSAGFSITVPIYDGGQRKLQYKKLGLEEETRVAYKTFFSKQYQQQIAQLNQQIRENENLIAQINDQMKYTESLIKVDTKLLETGDLRISDLILAINNYLTIKNLLTQTTISRLQLINQLNYWNK
jgi:outer membrane protein TolC